MKLVLKDSIEKLLGPAHSEDLDQDGFVDPLVHVEPAVVGHVPTVLEASTSLHHVPHALPAPVEAVPSVPGLAHSISQSPTPLSAMQPSSIFLGSNPTAFGSQLFHTGSGALNGFLVNPCVNAWGQIIACNL